jgi:hypothetical protein
VFSPRLDAAELRASLSLLFQFPANSPLLHLRRGNSIHCGDNCVGLQVPAALPRQMAQNLAYYHRKAARAGLGAPHQAGPEAFAALVELHARRWHERRERLQPSPAT